MTRRMLTQTPVKGRIFLLSIIALFVLPLVLAWGLVGRWQPERTSNHGELLEPARTVPPLQVRQMNGRELDKNYLQGYWTLAYIANTCDPQCKSSLYYMRQVRQALGKNRERAQTLFMMSRPPDAMIREWLRTEHATTTVGVADKRTLEFFSRVFPDEPQVGDWIYLIDPLGNLFMRYGMEDDSKGMLDDLEHLLKYSKIG